MTTDYITQANILDALLDVHRAKSKLGSFVFRNQATFFIMLKIYLRHAKCQIRQAAKEQHLCVPYTYENLLAEIPRKIASRSTVLVTLKDGVQAGFLEKTKSPTDKRLRFYEIKQQHLVDIRDTIERKLRWEKGFAT